MPDPGHTAVVVVGGGISGLATAYLLQKRGFDVLVLEKAGRTGGAIRSWREDGYLIEAGPNSTLETTPLLTSLIAETGIESEKRYADDRSSNRFILRDGRLVPLPMSAGAFLRTRLFGASAKLRLFREPFIRPSAPDAEESVSEFVLRRLGKEFLDYAINPFVAGVYAGDPDQLDVRAAFPKLHELEQKYGSLIKGQILGARERRRRGEAPRISARMFSFRDGMETLTSAVARALRSVETNVAIRSLNPGSGDGVGWAIEAQAGSGPRTYTCNALVLAAQADAAAGLVRPFAPAAADALAGIPYPPVAVVVSGFRPGAGMHALDGFGFLVPKRENRGILGTIFTSSLFADRAPEGHALLTTFVGGMRQPELALQSEERIAELALKEQTSLLGAPMHPEFVHVTSWERAIAQYVRGHLERIRRIEETETRTPGLFFCANYRGGISVGDCVKSADRTAARVEEFLRAGGRR